VTQERAPNAARIPAMGPGGPRNGPRSGDPGALASFDVYVEPASDLWVAAARLLMFLSVLGASWHVFRPGTLNITFADIAFFACFGIIAGTGRLNGAPFGSITPLWFLAVTMMLGGLFVSTALHGDLSRWLVVAAQYILALCLIPMLLNSYTAADTRRLPFIYCIGVTLSEAIGIIAINLFSYGQTSALLGTKFITGSGRLGALAGEANWNGAVIAFALPMLIYSVHKKVIGWITASVCCAILIWGLLLSASFTGFSATLLSVTVTLFLLGWRQVVRLAVMIGLAGALFMASGAPLPSTFEKRVAGAITSGDLNQAGTFAGRAELIREAWVIAEDTAGVGLGVDRYREVSLHGAPVHQLYLLIWTEGGFIAFLGLLSILGLLGFLTFNAVRVDRAAGAMAAGVLVVLLVYTMSSAHMYARLWLMPVMVALSTVYARPGVHPSPSLRRPHDVAVK
jgi:O-antigen ligase